MSFLSFSAWQFALAGAICAAAPILIHLLNRRRYRVVHWAAMPFLREALQRNRKMMQLRDLLLLLLRTAAVVFFGLALARPFFAAGQQDFDRSKPLHAILVLDNSLSMGYTQVDGTLLDRAKERARQFVGELPEGSLVTVLPLCGTQHPISTDPYPYKDKALLEAIDAVEVVDRSASLQRAVDAAKRSSEETAHLAKRVVFFSDQQTINWRDLLNAEQFKQLPSMQVVDVAPAEWENTWISDVRVQDGLADIETPTTIIVELQHRSTQAARKDIQVSFFVDGELIAEKPVSLDGQTGLREVSFEHTFSTITPPDGQPEYVPIKVTISADNLMADNERHLVVPVVASIPVVFIDQYRDDEEDTVQKRIGETRHLRTLLAPTSSRDAMKRQLIKIKHIKIEDLQQSDLEDARLVVVGGIRSPESETTVRLLRDYVKQGGQLVIGAGGEFDPQAWTELAWLDGGGILPVPLDGHPVGNALDEAASQLNPVFLSYESLGAHYYFQLGDTGEQQLRDIYSDPMFFKYVQAPVTPEVVDRLREAELKRLEEEFAAVAEADRLRAELAKKDAAGELDEAGRRQLQEAEERVRQFRPQWLRWAHASPAEELPSDETQRKRQLEALALATVPQARARFVSENGPPYLIERSIGRGNVLFVSSGLYSSWNTLPLTDTFFVFDRILRSMIRSTLPNRNFRPVERITLPLPADDREAEVLLMRPGREDDPEPIDPGFIGKEQLGITINKPLTRGLYEVTALKPAISSDAKATMEKAWEQDLLFAVNGDGAESDLTPLSRDAFEERAAGSEVRWVGPGDTISLAGASISGQNSWKYLIILVLVFLLSEILILAWPAVKARLAEPAAPQA